MLTQLFLLTVSVLGWVTIITLAVAVGLALHWTFEQWESARDWETWTSEAVELTKEK